MSLNEDLENVINNGLQLFDEMDYHYNEFMKLKKQCDIIQNYVNIVKSQRCFHF